MMTQSATAECQEKGHFDFIWIQDSIHSGGVEGGGAIISQLVKGFMPFSRLVKLFGRVSQIFINLV